MCDPFTLAMLAISAATTVGGGMVNSSEQRQNTRDMIAQRERVYQEEKRRQGAYQEEAAAAFGGALDHYAPEAQQQQLGELQADRGADIAAAVAPPTQISMPGSTPEVVQSAIGKKMSDAFTAMQGEAQRKGALNAYGDLFQGNNFAIGDARRDIDTVRDFSGVSSRLFGQEDNTAAATANKPLSGLGDALKAVGQIAGSAAGKGIPMGASAGTAAAGAATGSPMQLWPPPAFKVYG